MQHVFWLRPNLIAGRSGPNLHPWNPAELAAAGIGAVLSVNDAASVYADDLSNVGIDSACIPLADNAPPRVGDFEHCLEMLPRSLAYLLTAIEAGKTPLIHCTAGKDRTGLTMCHYLCQQEAYSPPRRHRRSTAGTPDCAVGNGLRGIFPGSPARALPLNRMDFLQLTVNALFILLLASILAWILIYRRLNPDDLPSGGTTAGINYW